MHSRIIAAATAFGLIFVSLLAEAAPPVRRGTGEVALTPVRDEFGFLLEPWAGGSMGSYSGDISGTVPAAESLSLMGFGGGASFGVIYRYFFAAARAQYFKLSNSNLPDGVSNLGLGLIGGATLSSIPLRLWAGFHLKDTLTVGTQELPGNCFSLGAGWFFTDKISLNFEFNSRSYGKTVISGSLEQTKFNNFVISLSRPFALGVESQRELSKNLSNESDTKPRGNGGFNF